MVPYAYAIGEKYTYFIYHRYKFIENDKIEEGTLLNSSNGSLDPYDYHLENCCKDAFYTTEANRVHSSWPGKDCGLFFPYEDEEDIEEVVVDNVDIQEREYTNGNDEVVKFLNRKCVICLERDSEYIFKQCGHQSFCQVYYQNKGDIDILKCVVCRKKYYFFY